MESTANLVFFFSSVLPLPGSWINMMIGYIHQQIYYHIDQGYPQYEALDHG